MKLADLTDPIKFKALRKKILKRTYMSKQFPLKILKGQEILLCRPGGVRAMR